MKVTSGVPSGQDFLPSPSLSNRVGLGRDEKFKICFRLFVFWEFKGGIPLTFTLKGRGWGLGQE